MKRFISWLKCFFGKHDWVFLEGLTLPARICNECHRVEEIGEYGRWTKVED